MKQVHASRACVFASGLIFYLLIRLLTRRVLQSLLPDWPDWDVHTIRVD